MAFFGACIEPPDRCTFRQESNSLEVALFVDVPKFTHQNLASSDTRFNRVQNGRAFAREFSERFFAFQTMRSWLSEMVTTGDIRPPETPRALSLPGNFCHVHNEGSFAHEKTHFVHLGNTGPQRPSRIPALRKSFIRIPAQVHQLTPIAHVACWHSLAFLKEPEKVAARHTTYPANYREIREIRSRVRKRTWIFRNCSGRGNFQHQDERHIDAEKYPLGIFGERLGANIPFGIFTARKCLAIFAALRS